MRAFILKTIASLCLLGAESKIIEHNIEVTPSVGVTDLHKNSSVNVDYQLIKGCKKSYFFLNPRMDVLMSKTYSAGLGVGVRKELGYSLAGIHLFGDYSYMYGAHHFQVGPSLEYIHPRWDVTLNYYLPISGQVFHDNSIVQAVHYVDGRFFYKTRFIDFGVEPSYNCNKHQFGLVGHIEIPSAIGNFKISSGRNARHGDHVNIGVSIPLYGCTKDTHTAKVRRDTGVVHQVVNVPKPVVVIEPPKPVEPVVEVVEELQEEEWSLWDFLFGWLFSDDSTQTDQGLADYYYPSFDSPDYDYEYAATAVTTTAGGLSPAGGSDVALSDISAGYAASVPASADSPAADFSDSSSDSSHGGSSADIASLDTPGISDSAYLDSIGSSLAADGGYTMSIDVASASLSSVDLGSSPDFVSPPADTGCHSDGSSGEYDIITPNSSFSG